MNIRDLQYLAAVAENRHFGRAAEACNVSQPTLSMQLKKLEEYLGVQLFDRSRRRVAVTPAGEKVLRHARVILREVEEIREVARAAQDPLSGELRLGAFPTLAPYLLPRVVPEISKQLPNIRLLLVEEKTDDLIEMLEQGTLDAALLALPVGDDGLETAPLFEDRFLLAVPPGHHFAKKKSIKSAELADERLLLLEDGHCLRDQALDVCQMTGAAEQQDFRATSLETLRQMVASGVGITLIPELAKQDADGIVYIPFKNPPPSRTIGLVWRPGAAREASINALTQALSPKTKR